MEHNIDSLSHDYKKKYKIFMELENLSRQACIRSIFYIMAHIVWTVRGFDLIL